MSRDSIDEARNKAEGVIRSRLALVGLQGNQLQMAVDRALEGLEMYPDGAGVGYRFVEKKPVSVDQYVSGFLSQKGDSLGLENAKIGFSQMLRM